MNFVRDNKIFLFLFLSLSIIVTFLVVQVFSNARADNANDELEQSINVNPAISYFNGVFSDTRKGIEFSWNVQTGNLSISKYEIALEEVVLKEGKNAGSVVLSLKDFSFKTGNNKFDLKIYFADGSLLTKSVYVYIDEAFCFTVNQKVEGHRILYTLTYVYDERRGVTPPQMSVKNSTQPFTMNFIESKEVGRNGNYIDMNVTYELLYANIDPGKYSVSIQWMFPTYNLVFTSNSDIEVEDGV